ncbi:MAG: hypothetical protein IKO51_10460 [Clostridia bacterium]|nr:hypothetical protein [Clostridia bacterium]
MKKKLIAFVIAATMLLSTIAGCTASPKPIADPTTANPVTEAPVTEAPTPNTTTPTPHDGEDNGTEYTIDADNDAYFLVSGDGEKLCLLRRDCPLSHEQVDALKSSIEADGTVNAAVFKKLVYSADEASYVYGSTSRDPADISKACFFTLRREGSGWTVSACTPYEEAKELCADIVSATKVERSLSDFEIVSAKELAKYTAVFKAFPIAFEIDELTEALSMLDAVYDEEVSERILKDEFYDFCMTVDDPNSPTDYSAIILVGIRADAEHNAVYDKLVAVFEGSADNYMPLFITKGTTAGDVLCQYIFNLNLVTLG